MYAFRTNFYSWFIVYFTVYLFFYLSLSLWAVWTKRRVKGAYSFHFILTFARLASSAWKDGGNIRTFSTNWNHCPLGSLEFLLKYYEGCGHCQNSLMWSGTEGWRQEQLQVSGVSLVLEYSLNVLWSSCIDIYLVTVLNVAASPLFVFCFARK